MPERRKRRKGKKLRRKEKKGRVKEGEGQETARLEMVGGSKKRHGCFAKPSG